MQVALLGDCLELAGCTARASVAPRYARGEGGRAGWASAGCDEDEDGGALVQPGPRLCLRACSPATLSASPDATRRAPIHGGGRAPLESLLRTPRRPA